jgi:hypothetical protein
LGKIPGPLDSVFHKVAEIISDEGTERIRIMLETVAEEVIEHEREIREIRDRQTIERNKVRNEQEAGLVVDGARRASTTRSTERVRRIGIILAKTISDPRPPKADEIEEMMRIAVELAKSTLDI